MNKKSISLIIKEKAEYYIGEIWQTSYHFIKWSLLSIFVGGLVGVISSGFAHVLSAAANYREGYPWLLFLLPVAGVTIIFLYKKFGKDDGGTNQVFSTVRARDEVPATAAPLIFVSTALTHLTGGSAGRMEGSLPASTQAWPPRPSCQQEHPGLPQQQARPRPPEPMLT